MHMHYRRGASPVSREWIHLITYGTDTHTNRANYASIFKHLHHFIFVSQNDIIILHIEILYNA